MPTDLDDPIWFEIPYRDSFPPDQYERLKGGFSSGVMEDKWEIEFAAPWLLLSRSWTGQPVFRVRLESSPSGCETSLSQSALEAYRSTPIYAAALLRYLVRSILLEESLPFPVPPGLDESEPRGVYQHMMVGRGGPEEVVEE